MTKIIFKQRAIDLRKQGKTYSEILNEIHVAKSTLSDWLKGVGLSVPQRQRITQKRKDAQRKGAEARHIDRVVRQEKIIHRSQKEIVTISNRELFLIGVALYWAEGSKEKKYDPGVRASFSNSDPQMISLFLKWLSECVRVPYHDISADLYIHESHRARVDEVIQSWARILNVSRSFIRHTYFKRNKIRTKRKNKGSLYLGLLRVNISASSDLNRRITGWIKGICDNCGVV